jgi:hypothetical protein
MALNNLTDWKRNFPDRQNVQPDEHKRSLEGSFLSGESAIVVAGPPEIKSRDTRNLIPVGLVQQAQLSQNKQLNQIFEIGGRVPFYVPSRVSVRASLSRILFDGPSLFYALYQRGDSDETTVPSLHDFATGASSTHNNPTTPYPADGSVVRAQGTNNVEQQDSNPGLFWSNLGSGIFNRPLGLGFVLFDMEGEPYGGAYLEKCYVQSHRFGISANATVLAENVSLVATRLKPIDASAMGR